ncbi:uncharacterized protein F5Z01DRAFT_673420 [Emericellopsis atlantica]|uniref:Uncharacterized protein n=1 Tax=Emericellopsis atlantica TaxID=2614577 RepID=A0A9P8CQT8_9HYPO|nr:uncharacterized protein F5Z01DRAFT_673420 [Emericellopsis atlantica]KAG9255480.1 hypothetical protein F5Z01DRAFT_673420 [Emericellopsis atlantica]
MSSLGVRDAPAKKGSQLAASLKAMGSTQAEYENHLKQRGELENQKTRREQLFKKAWLDATNLGKAADGVFDSAELHFAEHRKIRQQLADVREKEEASLQQLENSYRSYGLIIESQRSTQSASEYRVSPRSPTTSQRDAEALRPRDSTSPAQREAIDTMRTSDVCRSQEPNVDAIDAQSTVNCEREAGPDTADGNIDNVTEIQQPPPARVKRFSEINSGGQAIHGICKARRDKVNNWIFSCRGSKPACVKKRFFYHRTDDNLLNAVSRHATSHHGIATRDWPEICRQMGTRVIDCTEDDVKRNNEAFNGVVDRHAPKNNPKDKADPEYKTRGGKVPEQRATRDLRPRTAERPPSETTAELEQDAQTGAWASPERNTSPSGDMDMEAVLQEASEQARAALAESTQPQHALAPYSSEIFEPLPQAAPVAEMS